MNAKERASLEAAQRLQAERDQLHREMREAAGALVAAWCAGTLPTTPAERPAPIARRAQPRLFE